MRPNDTILVDSILQGADLCRRRETLKTGKLKTRRISRKHVQYLPKTNTVSTIMIMMKLCIKSQLNKVPSKALLAENHEFDPFQNGFDTEADPIISSHDFKQRSSSPEDQNSPQIVRRSIGSSPECSSDLGLDNKLAKSCQLEF